jgi:hypothetical protein
MKKRSDGIYSINCPARAAGCNRKILLSCWRNEILKKILIMG